MEPAIIHNKLTKSKGKMVKPILKKLSNSEKNSLDLDRPWEEQQVPGLGVSGSVYGLGSPTRSVRDVSFAFAEKPIVPTKTRYQHGRSPSGASHVSVASTASGGGPRPSTFVHPFQQTPRTQSPPLAFASSLTSLEKSLALNTSGIASSGVRDHSPTITENEDDDYYPPGSLPRHRQHNRATSGSQSGVRQPYLAAQRAASFNDIKATQLRVTAGRSVPNGYSRRGHGNSGLASSLSHSDLHLNSTATLDSPTSSGPTVPASLISSANSGAASVHTAAGSSASTPLSPLRSSLEGFPRLRSRSELYAGDRTEQIREARRKFEERERAKAEKHDREMLRKRERRDHKEAKEIERQAAVQSRKNSGGGGDSIRPSLSRKTTPTFGTSSGNSEHGHKHEGFKHSRVPPEPPAKPLAFKSSNYDNMMGGTTPSFGPTVDDVAFKNVRRNNTAKRKTQGYWNEFILWLRTRLFRLGRK